MNPQQCRGDWRWTVGAQQATAKVKDYIFKALTVITSGIYMIFPTCKRNLEAYSDQIVSLASYPSYFLEYEKPEPNGESTKIMLATCTNVFTQTGQKHVSYCFLNYWSRRRSYLGPGIRMVDQASLIWSRKLKDMVQDYYISSSQANLA